MEGVWVCVFKMTTVRTRGRSSAVRARSRKTRRVIDKAASILFGDDVILIFVTSARQAR